MNYKNLLCGGIIGTIFIFLFDWVVHGMLLIGQYQMYESLWRPEAEMQAMFGFLVLFQALLAFTITYYVHKLGKKGWEAGAEFGCMVGVFLAVMAVTQYVHMPVSFFLPAMWAISIFVTSTCVGAIAGWCNRG